MTVPSITTDRLRLNRHPNTRWVHLTRLPKADHTLLFCFPHSGAGASIYTNWANAMPGPVTVCPVELPGHGQRISEPLYKSLPALVKDAAAALRPYLDHPFAFFGHSLGALVCYELARYLQQEYQRVPVHLFVSGNSAPHIPIRSSKPPSAGGEALSGCQVETPYSSLSEEEFIEKVRELKGTDEAFFASPDMRDVFLPILRADFELCESYIFRPGTSLEAPITALGGLADPFVSREELEAWKSYTTKSFKLRMFPGEHFYLFDHQLTLLEILARELIRLPIYT